jgi:hypothetical protein
MNHPIYLLQVSYLASEAQKLRSVKIEENAATVLGQKCSLHHWQHGSLLTRYISMYLILDMVIVSTK